MESVVDSKALCKILLKVLAQVVKMPLAQFNIIDDGWNQCWLWQFNTTIIFMLSTHAKIIRWVPLILNLKSYCSQILNGHINQCLVRTHKNTIINM